MMKIAEDGTERNQTLLVLSQLFCVNISFSGKEKQLSNIKRSSTSQKSILLYNLSINNN